MSKIIRNNELDAEKFVELLTNNELIVYESVQGSKIWCNYVNNNWIIRPKSVNQNPLNFIDLAVQKYYNHAFAYLLSLPEEATDLLRPNYYFCFEYFPDEQPAHIKYDRIPKNHLILTCICKYGKEYINEYDELKVFANLLNVETLPIVYKGKLNDRQLKAITYFLTTNKKDLELFFKESNFTEFFFKILNPFLKNSFLKEQGYQNNLEKIIIRLANNEYTLEILNPMYQKMSLKTDSEFSDVYSILLFNFMQWLITVDLDEIEVQGKFEEQVYINLISKLYNMYIDKYEKNILDFVFTVPEFFNNNKFRINQQLISNKTTIDYINKHSKLEYLFKILLSSFQREFKKEIGIINNIALGHLNGMIKKIQIKVNDIYNHNLRIDKYSYQLQDLKDFPNIQWEEDSRGYTYPEIGSLLQDNEENKKKLDKFKK